MAGEGAGKKLWGYYPTTKVWVPLQVDENGKVVVDMSAIALTDLGDLSGLLPDDQHVLDAEVLAVAAALVHAARHQDGGDDEISLAGLSGEPADAIAKSLLTTQGDIITRDASAPKRLAKGTAGYYLTAGASEPEWAAPPSKIQDADGDTKIQCEESADEDKIRMDVKGVEAFLMHDDGILDLAKQSSFGVHLEGNQSIPTGTWTVIEWNAEDWDIQGEFDLVTHTCTIKTAGIYVISLSGQMVLLGDRDMFRLILRVNTVAMAEARDYASGIATYPTMGLSTVLQLAVDDVLDVRAYHTYGSNRDLAGNILLTNFRGVKMA